MTITSHRTYKLLFSGYFCTLSSKSIRIYTTDKNMSEISMGRKIFNGLIILVYVASGAMKMFPINEDMAKQMVLLIYLLQFKTLSLL